MDLVIDTELSGEVMHMGATREGRQGDIVVHAEIKTEDGATRTASLRICASGAAYLRDVIEEAMPTADIVERGLGVESRTYRTELNYVPADSDGPGQPGWTLYVDAEKIAHTPQPLTRDQATAWAGAQLDQHMTWIADRSAESLYLVPAR